MIILLQELNVLFLESILVTLGRLVKELIDFACAQQLDKFSQCAVIDIVLALDLLGYGFVLTRIVRQSLILVPTLLRLFQGGAGNLHQLGNGSAAADVVLIHHVADPGTVKRVTGLQQRNPAAVKRGLLLTDGLQNGKVIFVVFQRAEEQSAGGDL